MGGRIRGGWLTLGCLLVVGCGSAAVVHDRLSRRPQPGRTAAQRCVAAARVVHVGVFPAWHMGAVQFLSAASGVGITAGSFPCFQRVMGGENVGSQRQSVWLALSSDGGRFWHVTGAPVPLGTVRGGVVAEQIAAVSPDDVWAVVGKGRLVATHDGGSRWQIQPLPEPVVWIAVEKGRVWAASCPKAATRTAPFGCRPELWHSGSVIGSWTPVALPRVSAQDSSMVSVAATPEETMLAVAEPGARPRGELLISRDAGQRWTKRSAPTWDHNGCGNGAGLTALAPHTFWLLCGGTAAGAGSSTKGLLRSTDGGRSWRTMSAVTSLARPARPDSIPAAMASALAAGSQTRLWLSLYNWLTESTDAGARWTVVPRIEPSGWQSTFDVLNANHAWLLAPGAGLWHTNDGLHWGADGPLNTG